MTQQDVLKVLGIETSCDETAAAIVALHDGHRPEILSSVVLSQIDEHAAFGGVVPEIAARAHVEALDDIVEAAIAEAGIELADIDAVAATAGPGLIGGLIVGLMTAKAIASATGKPLIAVNHLEGHALTARLTNGLAFPYLLLLVSGGHTQIVLVRGVGAYERWATTIDDAARRSLRQDRQADWPPLSGRPECREGGGNGQSASFRVPASAQGRIAARLLLLGAEDCRPSVCHGNRTPDRS